MKLYYAFIKSVDDQLTDKSIDVLLFSVNVSDQIKKETEIKRKELESQSITQNEILNNTLLKADILPIFAFSHDSHVTHNKENITFAFKGYQLLKYYKKNSTPDVGCTSFLTLRLKSDSYFFSSIDIIKNILTETVGKDNYTYEGIFNYPFSPSSAIDGYENIYEYVNQHDSITYSKSTLETAITPAKTHNKLKKV